MRRGENLVLPCLRVQGIRSIHAGASTPVAYDRDVAIASPDDFDGIRKQVEAMQRALVASGSIQRIAEQADAMSRALQASGATNAAEQASKALEGLQASGQIGRISEAAVAATRYLETSGAVARIVEQNAAFTKALGSSAMTSRVQDQLEAYLRTLEAAKVIPPDLDLTATEEAPPDPKTRAGLLQTITSIDRLIGTLFAASAQFGADLSGNPTAKLVLDALAILIALRAVLTALAGGDRDE